MFSQRIGTFTNFTITIQVCIHNITSTPVTTHALLYLSKVSVHFGLCFGNTNCFISPKITIFFAIIMLT